jgi:hypothetical protein
MKYTILILTLINLIFSCGQNRSHLESEEVEIPKEYAASVDSVISEHEHGLVYITKDTSAVMYNWLAPKSIDTVTIENIGHDFIDENLYKLKHFTEVSLSQNWSPIHIYKNQYYVYSPSDWMASSNVLITDSVIYTLSSLHVSYLIANYTQENDRTFEFELLSSFAPERVFLKVTSVDVGKGITLWEYADDDRSIYHSELRVKSENVRNFNMIINDCLGTKCINEFHFEEKELEVLIKNVR